MIVLFNCISIISVTRIHKGNENGNENCHERKVAMQKKPRSKCAIVSFTYETHARALASKHKSDKLPCSVDL